MPLLVYTHKITPRLTYVFKHICERMLGLPVSFTTRVEDFIAHSGPKISYTRYPLGNEFFVKSHDLLFDRGISDLEFTLHDWKGIPCFFLTGDKSALPFDIFASSFYLLSRYEEYLPHVKDTFGRFPADESLAVKYNFLEIPIVDIWAQQFQKTLSLAFPDIVLPEKKFIFQSVIEVNEAFAFIQKGLGRSLLEILEEIYQLKFNHLLYRFASLVRLKKDPFDVYAWVSEQHNKTGAALQWFFMLANYSLTHKSINIHNSKFRLLIKHLSDIYKLGVVISFDGQNNAKILQEELNRLENIIHRKTDKSLQYKARLNLPETYRRLVELEIKEDYSMGYAGKIGFRAGTSHPFFFYDLGYEVQTPLKIIPFCLTDEAVQNSESTESNLKLNRLIQVIREVNGNFTAVFSHSAFSRLHHRNKLRAFYQKLLKASK